MKRLTTEERASKFARLPVWAQNELNKLTTLVEAQQSKIEELSTGHPDTNVKISGWISYPDRCLPVDSQVEFSMGDKSARGGWDTISVSHVRDNHVRNRLSIHGGQSLKILPKAGNSFEIEFDER